MVEVDPIILLAGTVIVGVVTVVSCMRQKKVKEVIAAPAEKPVSAPSVPVVASKPKKKSKPKSKSKSSASASEQTNVEATQVEVPEVVTAASEPEAPAPVEDEDKIEDMFVVNEAAKRSKKSKETQEQKASRLERQKVVTKAAKNEDDDDVFAQINAASYSSARDFNSNSQASNPPAFDGWAVVEDKRKLKLKKNESATDLDEIPPLMASTPQVIFVLAGALLMVEEAVSTPPVPIDSVTKEITVEAKKLGLLIGPKGVTKIGLQHATGTEISMPKVEKDHTGPVQIAVTGTAEGVDRAIFALNEFCTKGYCALLSSPDFHEGYVEVKPK